MVYLCVLSAEMCLRLLGSIGGYIYTQVQSQINVHLFMPSTYQIQVDGQDVVLTQKEQIGHGMGKVDFELKTKSEHLSLALRIPGWATSWKVSPNICICTTNEVLH